MAATALSVASHGQRPRFVDHWEDIAHLVRWLRDRRDSQDAKLVISGKMKEEEAARRKRLIGALDTVWQAIAARAAIPAIDVEWAELAEDCHAIAERAAREGDPQPYASGEIFDALRTALSWQMTIDRGRIEPRIVFVSRINQAIREQRCNARKT
jgi:hypothetical protein